MTTTKHGRRAQTEWKLESPFRHYSLLRVFPKTGKTHQIRVHLLSIGLPLAIDPIYNAGAPAILLSAFKRGYKGKKTETERPLIARLTLHAHRLTIVDTTGQARTIESPLPKDLRATLNMLTKYDR
jgi:23S rRNA pseudouridine955/2504/2580 synthase/23S rRNA pseudouridine1911/1915/1917 synthase